MKHSQDITAKFSSGIHIPNTYCTCPALDEQKNGSNNYYYYYYFFFSIIFTEYYYLFYSLVLRV